uniref:RAB20, member RAS oncogene family n=1 Tax=Scleropages formosus TaxID=113540 RepID=A0A8C9VH82_SCLFO
MWRRKKIKKSSNCCKKLHKVMKVMSDLQLVWTQMARDSTRRARKSGANNEDRETALTDTVTATVRGEERRPVPLTVTGGGGDREGGVLQLHRLLCEGALSSAVRVGLLQAGLLRAPLLLVLVLVADRRAHVARVRRVAVAPPAAQDPLHLVVELAHPVVVAVPPGSLLGLVVLPLEALDSDAALLGRAVEAHLAEPPGHVPVNVAVAKVSVQRRLHVLLAPDVQQRSGLHVRPQEAPRVRQHGREQFHGLGSMYCRGAAAVLLTYDVTNWQSLAELENRFLSLTDTANSDCIFAIVGNKADLADPKALVVEQEPEEEGSSLPCPTPPASPIAHKQVHKEDAMALYNRILRYKMLDEHISFPAEKMCFETSAKTGYNVDLLFETLFDMVLPSIMKNRSERSSPTVDLEEPLDVKRTKTGCCV